MLGFYNYTVILTYLGMLTGFYGITCLITGNRKGALVCLMIAGVCDMFDGKIASTMTRTKKEKRFGIQIDSLSDLICFGVLPALIVYTSAAGTVLFFPAAVYVLCALIRLSWFNVDEEERQDLESGSRSVYYGLPVTTAALIFPIMMEMCEKFGWSSARIGTMLLMIMAVSFLAPFKIRKPKLAGKIGILFIGSIGLIALFVGGMNI